MSASNNERPWAPAELDALEDALESLELAAPQALPSTLAPEQQHRIAERLASYRAIAGLSRELLGAYEAPASAIAAALAEARNAAPAAAGGSPIAAPLEPTTTSWWSRAKRLWLVPTLASAGVGALVVVLAVNRTADAPESAVVATSAERKADSKTDGTRAAESRPAPALAMAEPEPRAGDDAELTPTVTQRGAAAEASDDVRGRLLDRKTKADEAFDAQGKGERAEEELQEGERAQKELAKSKDAPAEQRRSATPARPVAPASPPADPSSDDPAPPSPEKKPSAAPNEGPKPKPSTGGAPGGGADPSAAALGDILVRADRARKSGDCETARRDYAQVIAKGDRKQRARAKAGTALCLERAGANASAEDLIAGARLDDPGIDAWLAAERGE